MGVFIGRACLVVPLAFVLVGEHFVGAVWLGGVLVDLSELVLGIVAGILVGVQFLGKHQHLSQRVCLLA